MSQQKMTFFSLGPQPAEVPPPGYTYKCEDMSLLKPVFYKLFVNPLADRLTGRTRPNDITFTSQVFAFLPFLFALFFLDTAPLWTWAVVPFIGFLGYIIFDHLDGTHARRSNQSSPLGELVDHWCDAWNSSIVPLGWGIAFDAPPVVLVVLSVFACYAYTFALSEQKATGVMKLDPMGGNEGMVLYALTLVPFAFFGRKAALDFQFIELHGYRLTWGSFMWFMAGYGCLGTVKNVFKRSGTLSIPDVVPFIVTSALPIAWVALTPKTPWLPIIACCQVAALSAIVNGRMVLARAAGLPYRWDGLGLVALIIGVLVGAAFPNDVRLQLTTATLVLLVVMFRAFADFLWGASTFARWIRPGEVLALFVRPAAVEEPPVADKASS